MSNDNFPLRTFRYLFKSSSENLLLRFFFHDAKQPQRRQDDDKRQMPLRDVSKTRG